MSQDRLQAGDIKIVEAVVFNKEDKGIDIRNQIKEIKIFESMFSAFITGEVTISDAVGISTLLPFVGEEMLMLELETPTGTADELQNYLKRKMLFHVYKMSNQANITMKNKMYTLGIISVSGMVDINRAISKKFSGNVSDLAKSLIEDAEYLNFGKDTAIVEPTTNSLQYVSNFWTPAKNLFYLAENALNDKKNPNYVFFENNNGFVFSSLDRLQKVPVIQSFFKDQKMRQPGDPNVLDDDYQTILDMSVSENVFDYIDRHVTGGYGGTMYEYAFDTKSIKKTIKRYDEYNPEDPNAVSPFSSAAFDPRSHILNIPVHRNLFNGSQNLDIDHHTRRAALLKKLTNIQTNIQVFGRFDYTVGRQVDLTIYKDRSIDGSTPDTALEDELLSGVYMITSLSHVITPTIHRTNMELSKSNMKAKPSL